LAKDRIPLTVCPLSNQKLKVFPDLRDHSLRQLLDAGLCAMINSDDPAYFGGYMNENWLATFEALNLDATHAVQLAKNSFEASFCNAAMKRKYVDRVSAVVEAFY
jgi:adenosine deaminase